MEELTELVKGILSEVELDVELVERRVASEWGRIRLFCFDVPWSLSLLLRRAYSATGVSVNCKIYHLSNDIAFPEYIAVCNGDMFNFDVVYEDGIVRLVYANVALPPSGLYLWGFHQDPRRPPVPDSP